MSSDTSAYLSSQSKVSGEITAGEWEVEDESELAFLDKGNQNIKSCPANMKVKLKNTGKGPMLEKSTYEIYYVANGNPKKHGTKVQLDQGEGVVKTLEKGETVILSHETDRPGRYIFKAYQAGDHEEKTAVWSKEIKVDCKKKADKEVDGKTKDKATEQEKPEKEAHKEETREKKQTNDQSDQGNQGKDKAETKFDPESNKAENDSQNGQKQEKEAADDGTAKGKAAEKKSIEPKKEGNPDVKPKTVEKKVMTNQNKEGAPNEETENSEVDK